MPFLLPTLAKFPATCSSLEAPIPSAFPYPTPRIHTNRLEVPRLRRQQTSPGFCNISLSRHNVLPTSEGGMDEHGLVIRHCFSVKSYEVDGDLKLTVETMMKYMQETVINHLAMVGLSDNWFASTREMRRKDLVWVVRRADISLHSYPSWREVIEVKTRFSISSNGLKFIYQLQNSDSGEIMATASSTLVAVNKTKMKLSRELDEVIREMEPRSMKCDPVALMDTKRVHRLEANKAHNVRKDITTIWSDIDPNAHVSNYKYVNWILEGLPLSISKKYELRRVLLEFKRGCGPGSNLQSLSTEVTERVDADSRTEGVIKFDHLLVLDDGTDVVRSRTEWSPKYNTQFRKPLR